MSLLADVDIPGLPTEFKAHSKIDSSTSAGAFGENDVEWGFSYQKPEDQRLLDGYTKIHGYDRSVDTEPKILEDIAARTDGTSTGTVILYTERYPCESCLAVIQSFRELRPSISLLVFYG